jgi:catechol 2,3-dioxygenase-like lactoylglutathione lyase family enzyme
MDMKLEVVVVPVSDVDRARDFYQALGWRQDADFATGPGFRVVQMTPPGSACAIIFGTGITSATPGSAQGLQLVVNDIDAARAELAGHGADVSEVFHDGNSWFVQEVTTRLPGRVTSALAVYDSLAGLAGALRRAEAAHGKYEEETGHPDPDWPDWYARYMADEVAGQTKGEGEVGGV